MILEINPLRFGAMFAPFWLLLGPSLYLYWDEWMRQPLLLSVLGGMPVIAAALAATILQGRWRLEISPQGLIHHTLGNTETFEWGRMGPVTARRRGPLHLFSAFGFAYPVDAEAPQEILSKHLGRSVLAIFGPHGAAKTAALLESRRAAFTAGRR